MLYYGDMNQHTKAKERELRKQLEELSPTPTGRALAVFEYYRRGWLDDANADRPEFERLEQQYKLEKGLLDQVAEVWLRLCGNRMMTQKWLTFKIEIYDNQRDLKSALALVDKTTEEQRKRREANQKKRVLQDTAKWLRKIQDVRKDLHRGSDIRSVCSKHDISMCSYYRWARRFEATGVLEAECGYSGDRWEYAKDLSDLVQRVLQVRKLVKKGSALLKATKQVGLNVPAFRMWSERLASKGLIEREVYESTRGRHTSEESKLERIRRIWDEVRKGQALSMACRTVGVNYRIYQAWIEEFMARGIIKKEECPKRPNETAGLRETTTKVQKIRGYTRDGLSLVDACNKEGYSTAQYHSSVEKLCRLGILTKDPFIGLDLTTDEKSLDEELRTYDLAEKVRLVTKDVDNGLPLNIACNKQEISLRTYYRWKKDLNID